jgi:hypothetical protein
MRWQRAAARVPVACRRRIRLGLPVPLSHPGHFELPPNRQGNAARVTGHEVDCKSPESVGTVNGAMAGRLLPRIALLVCTAHVLLHPVGASAQTAEELAVARKTFAQGVADQDAKRFESALEEFRRVAAVRDTANVRFRIASCLEALGRMAEALSNYDAAVFIGEGDQAAAAAVRASRERAAQLDRVVARLTLVFATPPPAGVEVRVDDARIDPAQLRDPIALDSGHHSVTATAPGGESFRTGVTLPEGGQASITIELRPLTSGDLHEGPAPAGETHDAPAPVDRSQSKSVPTAAYAALGIGGALAVGSVVSLVLRASNIEKLNRACTVLPGDKLQCPTSSASDVNAAHDAAQVQGPLGIGLGLGAAVAAGVGVWLIVTAPSKSSVRTTSGSQGLHLGPMLVPQGGGIVLCTTL